MRFLILTIIVLLSYTNVVLAQGGVQFRTDLNYEQALALAKKEKKKVFIDFYTTWCVPCKTMDKEVFTDAAVAKYMNATFVNLKVDAEKGDGIALARKFKVSAYPTFVVSNDKDEEVIKFAGAMKAPLFIEKIEKGIDPQYRAEALAERYANGDRTPKFIHDYAFSVLTSGDEDKGMKIINDYFNSLSAEQKSAAENLFLFERYATNFRDLKTQYLLNNRNSFLKTMGADKYNTITRRFLRLELLTYANGFHFKKGTYVAEDYQNLLKVIQKINLPDSLSLNHLINIAEVQATRDLKNILDVIELEFPKLAKNDRFLLIMMFTDFKENRELANRALALIEKSIHEVSPNLHAAVGRVQNELTPKGEIINFLSVSYQEAIDLAAKQNKLVFLDCYTVWCGPCKWLDENTFTDPTLKAYFDKHFVNIKIDMEKGEGIELAKKLQVRAYPSMFFIDGKGNIIHKLTGALDATKMMQEVASFTKK
ncbi:thioredoxin family protein [Sphingobacterium bovistauri]|uniref:Thioredoxin family protein n=1 Tax=Sphingobacterium bovistauri TaxID=2781959 RepID=A0ABS7ZBC3_9SPHI|nr:thioredoxin family protein [Sphingobacterium bovistauri]MCA5006234.1 thioredoxin family protein [Sphingobacterium bovistauri]